MRSMDRGMTNASTAMARARLAISIAAGLLASLPALAQNPGNDRGAKAQVTPPEPSTATLDKVLVVGSNIRDAVGGGASPVIVIDKEAIDRTGVATVQQLFEKLPQNFGGGANGANVANLGVDRDTGNNFGQGTALGGDLRPAGTDQHRGSQILL
ncbi:MAG: TonB-dependent receptor, partial [Stenotrophomonas maltophilia]